MNLDWIEEQDSFKIDPHKIFRHCGRACSDGASGTGQRKLQPSS
jgi:hypothetical protein